MTTVTATRGNDLALPPPPVPVDPGLREMSPRDFADFTHELYLCGRLGWEEYRLVGFPSELDPRWNSTIGALTGEPADPDRPRDMLAEWERRVDFMHRFQAADPATATAERVLAVLERFAPPATEATQGKP